MGQLQDAIIEHGQGRFEMRPEGDEKDVSMLQRRIDVYCSTFECLL